MSDIIRFEINATTWTITRKSMHCVAEFSFEQLTWLDLKRSPSSDDATELINQHPRFWLRHMVSLRIPSNTGCRLICPEVLFRCNGVGYNQQLVNSTFFSLEYYQKHHVINRRIHERMPSGTVQMALFADRMICHPSKHFPSGPVLGHIWSSWITQLA